MIKTYNLLITGLLLILVAGYTSYTKYRAESDIEKKKQVIEDETNPLDMIYYAKPKTINLGDSREKLENLHKSSELLKQQNSCAKSNEPAESLFNRLPTKSFCINADNFFIKQVSPFSSYIIEFEKNKVTRILDKSAEMPASTAEIAGQAVTKIRLNSNLQPVERFRQNLLLDKKILESDVVQLIDLAEGFPQSQHFQGTDWSGVVRAGIGSVLTILKGSSSCSFEGGSSEVEQLAKMLFLDDDESSPREEIKKDGIFSKAWGMISLIKRRIDSAFYAEALMRRYDRDYLHLRYLNETRFGRELSSANSFKMQDHSKMLKESLLGVKAASIEFFNQDNVEKLRPMEALALSVAPRNPNMLRLLQMKSDKKIDRKKFYQIVKFFNRLKILADRFITKKEEEQNQAALTVYRKATEQIPLVKLEEIKDFSAEEIQTRFASYKKFLPTLRIREDDDMSGEATQFMYHDEVKKKIDAYLKATNTDPETILGKKFAVILSYEADLQSTFSSIIEERNAKRQNYGAAQIYQILKTKLAGIKTDMTVQTVLADKQGRILVNLSLRVKQGKITPNRRFFEYRAVLASLAKVLHNGAGLDSGIPLDEVACSSDAVTENGYFFPDRSADQCMTFTEALQRSWNPAQLIMLKKLGAETATSYWNRGFGNPKDNTGNFTYPENFGDYSPLEKDKWTYEWARGLNNENAEKTALEIIEAFTPFANDGFRSPVSHIDKIYIGNSVIAENSEKTSVFKPETTRTISSILQKNGQTAFGLNDKSPAQKTGSSAKSYQNIVWNDKFLLLSRVIVLSPLVDIYDDFTKADKVIKQIIINSQIEVKISLEKRQAILLEVLRSIEEFQQSETHQALKPELKREFEDLTALLKKIEAEKENTTAEALKTAEQKLSLMIANPGRKTNDLSKEIKRFEENLAAKSGAIIAAEIVLPLNQILIKWLYANRKNRFFL